VTGSVINNKYSGLVHSLKSVAFASDAEGGARQSFEGCHESVMGSPHPTFGGVREDG